jgi:ATP adenylyltransferase
MQYISGPHPRSARVESSESAPTPPQDDEDVIAEDGQMVELESTGCVFCDRIRYPQSHDRVSLILLRAEHNFVILNLYPYNTGHLMVVPYKHTATFVSLQSHTLAEMMSIAQRLIAALGDEYHPHGYNMGMNLGMVAGAGVADHLHLHIVPRWAGDTNFMPIVGSTKVLPELLETTYDRLKARLAL